MICIGASLPMNKLDTSFSINYYPLLCFLISKINLFLTIETITNHLNHEK